MQQNTTTIIDTGVLSDMQWLGPVSARNLVDTKFTTTENIEAAISAINQFYVPVNPKAPTRCIDGRHDPALDEKHLGPQVPGGAPGAALAYRLGVDKDDLTRGTFLADAEAMISTFARMGFAPGGHRDEHSLNNKNAGCGAIDGMDKILAAMTDAHLVNDHKRVVKMLQGVTFNRDNYLRVLGAALTLRGHSDEYFLNREAIIDMLEQRSKKSISTLKGEHHECIVVVNLVQGTTLSSNRFSENFNGIQAFGYDMWLSAEMAQKLLPLPELIVDRQRFVMARIMTSVATLMGLTDGSQRLLIRINTPDEELDTANA